MYDKSLPTTIQSLFNSIAPSYDRANQIMSLGFHRYWNRLLTRQLKKQSKAGTFLDLCAGTGAIAFTYLIDESCPPTTYLLDFSSSMLEVAKEKSKNYPFKDSLHYIEGNAEKIPLDSNSIDHISLAYGIRNIKRPEECMKEAFRILKQGGSFAILELTRPRNALLRFLHASYLKLLPLVGKWIASNKAAYDYLSSSIQQFASPDELKKMLCNVGFSHVEIKPLLGGISTLIIAKK